MFTSNLLPTAHLLAMPPHISLVDSLELEGVDGDAVAVSRDSMMRNITPSTGVFLDILIRDARPR